MPMNNIKNVLYLWNVCQNNASYTCAENLACKKARMLAIKKDVNPNDTENIKIALKDGWDYFSARNY
jgi:hypothetical protein